MTVKVTLNRPQNSLCHQILVMHHRLEIRKIKAERLSPVVLQHSSFEMHYLINDDVGSLLAMPNYSHSMTDFTDKCLKCDCALLMIKDRPICFFQCQSYGILCWYSAKTLLFPSFAELISWCTVKLCKSLFRGGGGAAGTCEAIRWSRQQMGLCIGCPPNPF